MNAVDTRTLKPKAARELAGELQARCYKLENLLDDLARAVEIAQYTKQYTVTEVFVQESLEYLKDRIVIPETDQSDQKYTVLHGDADIDLVNAVREKYAGTQGQVAVDPDFVKSVHRKIATKSADA